MRTPVDSYGGRLVFVPGIGSCVSPEHALNNPLVKVLAAIACESGLDFTILNAHSRVSDTEFVYRPPEQVLDVHPPKKGDVLVGHSLGSLAAIKAFEAGHQASIVIAPPGTASQSNILRHGHRLVHYFGNESVLHERQDRVHLQSSTGDLLTAGLQQLTLFNTVPVSTFANITSIVVANDKLYPDWQELYEPTGVLDGSSHSLLAPGMLNENFRDIVAQCINRAITR